MELGIKEAINRFTDQELEKVKFDLDHGAHHLKRLVTKEIKSREQRHIQICATCGKDLSEVSSPYTLVFGPDDFRKKASFCGLDCFEFFLEKIKSIKKKNN